ncbi:hypothetical protein Pint_30937 [Pistacia integerrima]|uniref:Uncharacterized protein n=1 Tax=Pistacia integerrima TaxID=434235 RepID=A0ACC0XSZ9_9ROSI|nr:hypothetical protein Pint_30937 [Pistacia integerrima]
MKERKRGCYLPQDFQYDILTRLPTKSLVRFKSVCKQWCNLISDSNFSKLHLQKCMSKVIIFSWRREAYRSYGYYCSYKLDEKGVTATNLGPFQFPISPMLFSVAFCDNLMLFDHDYSSLTTWLSVYDAITHHRRELLPPLHTCQQSLGRYLVLVYDASSQKYKAVVLSFSGELAHLDHCYICSLGSENEESWRQSTPPLLQSVRHKFLPVVVKGILYWIAERPEKGYDVFVQPMNVATEEFMASIPVPCPPQDSFPPSGNYKMKLLEMKESLCLANPTSPDELDIWILKLSDESIWIKLHKICLDSMVNRPAGLTSFFRGVFLPWLVTESCNNKLGYMLVQHTAHSLYWYNLDTKEMKHIAMDTNQMNHVAPLGESAGYLMQLSVIKN